MTISYSSTIIIEKDKDLTCRQCKTVICKENEDWKDKAILDEQKLADIGGEEYAGTSDNVMLRQFYCPGCGSLLDTEIALKGEPFLKDKIWT